MNNAEIGEEEKSVIKKPNENEEKDMKEEEEKEEEEEKGEENEEKEEKIEENVDLVEQSSVQSSLLSSRVSPDRRCSARFLSKSVALTLRQLQRDEYNATVAQLVRENAVFYDRQRLCETIFTILILSSFTLFSVYLVMAHGFEYFHTANFTMVYQTPYTWSKEGVQVDLMCQTDMPWEWCRWIHMDEYCEWEWISESEGVKLTGCNMVDVDLIGEYNLHQCGVRVMVDAEHEGEWLCEIEKYHPGFSRRYGEVLYGHITLSVIEDLIYTETTPTLSTTLEPATNTTSHTTTSPAMDKAQRELEEYERQFFILKIVVRCGVILTLGGLAIIFGLMFLASWRAFDHNTGKSAHPPTDDSSDDINQGFGEEDPMLTKRLLQTRRKSVAFSVCVLDRDSMTFEMDRKKVLINSTDRIPNTSFCPLPTLSEDCETEKIPIPLSLITRHKIRHPSVNRARRMSLPHGPLTEGLLDCVDGTKIGLHCSNPLAFSRNSIETIM